MPIYNTLNEALRDFPAKHIFLNSPFHETPTTTPPLSRNSSATDLTTEYTIRDSPVEMPKRPQVTGYIPPRPKSRPVLKGRIPSSRTSLDGNYRGGSESIHALSPVMEQGNPMEAEGKGYEMEELEPERDGVVGRNVSLRRNDSVLDVEREGKDGGKGDEWKSRKGAKGARGPGYEKMEAEIHERKTREQRDIREREMRSWMLKCGGQK